jgi:uncharacterized protein YaaW (UPF0174 family)
MEPMGISLHALRPLLATAVLLQAVLLAAAVVLLRCVETAVGPVAALLLTVDAA